MKASHYHMLVRQNHVYVRQTKNASECTLGGDIVSALHHPGPCGLSEPCDTVRASVARQESRVTSFEMGLSRIVSDDMDVLALFSGPCVEDWIIHLLSSLKSINYMTWTWEGPMSR